MTRWSAVWTVLALVGSSCGADGGEDQDVVSEIFCETNAGGGCVCSEQSAPELSECSADSVGGSALCCLDATAGYCMCNAMSCGFDDEFCSCGSRAAVLREGQTEGDSCPATEEWTCCLAPWAGSAGVSCTCAEGPCPAGDEEVDACDSEIVMDCGSTDNVDVCL